MRRTHLSPPIERASPNDVVTLATDRGPAPMNIGAVLIIDGGLISTSRPSGRFSKAVFQRVRRLRQRLLKMPFGCGRPIWVDQPDFDLGRHLSQTVLPSSPGASMDPDEASDERVLEIAADLVCTPLPRHQPLWAACWVTDLAHDRAALVLVMHHAMTDGVAGLAVLAALGDDGTIPVIDPFPQPPPPLRSVAAAAWRDRAAALTTIPSRLRGRQGLHELGIRARRPKLAARTSLNRPPVRDAG